MTIVINSDDVEQLHWCLLQVGGKPSRWPQVLVTLAYAEKVARLADGDGDCDGDADGDGDGDGKVDQAVL